MRWTLLQGTRYALCLRDSFGACFRRSDCFWTCAWLLFRSMHCSTSLHWSQIASLISIVHMLVAKKRAPGCTRIPWLAAVWLSYSCASWKHSLLSPLDDFVILRHVARGVLLRAVRLDLFPMCGEQKRYHDVLFQPWPKPMHDQWRPLQLGCLARTFPTGYPWMQVPVLHELQWNGPLPRWKGCLQFAPN